MLEEDFDNYQEESIMYSNDASDGINLYRQGYRIYSGVPYKKKSWAIEKYKSLYNSDELYHIDPVTAFSMFDPTTIKVLSCLSSSGRKKPFEIADELNIVSYNTSFYTYELLDDNTPIYTKMDKADILSWLPFEYPYLSHSGINEVLEHISINKRKDHIPDFNFNRFAKKKKPPIQFSKELLQHLRYILFDSKIGSRRYIFSLMSEAKMGKSTYSNFLSYLFQSEYCAMNLSTFNRFSTATCAGARFVVFNDCECVHLGEQEAIFKAISGGDTIVIEPKGIQAYNGYMDANMLMIGNEKFTYNTIDTGWSTRVIQLNIDAIKGDIIEGLDSYEWSDEEIAYVIDQARNIEPMSYESKLIETQKKAVVATDHFLFIDKSFEEYELTKGLRFKLNASNFIRFKNMVYKLFDNDFKELGRTLRYIQKRRQSKVDEKEFALDDTTRVADTIKSYFGIEDESIFDDLKAFYGD